jgi:hypothetical protein
MKNKINILAAVFILVVTLLACGGSAPASPSAASDPAAVATSVRATLQALTASAPQPTMTRSGPALTSTPILLAYTLTPIIPTVSDVDASSAKAIYFAIGSTSTTVYGTVNAEQSVVYSLYVMANQPARISLGSQNNDVTMSIQGGDGRQLLSPDLNLANWQGYFPRSQTYFIKVYGGAAKSNFQLSMNISARVTFDPETSEIKYRGQTADIISYALYVSQGQTMTVSIENPPEIAGLTIWGFTDGQPYAKAESGTTSFSMTVPVTQDYIIDIVPQQIGQIVSYRLKVWIK